MKVRLSRWLRVVTIAVVAFVEACTPGGGGASGQPSSPDGGSTPPRTDY
jgi:hypothetical protein